MQSNSDLDSLLEDYRAKWSGCTACELCRTRKKPVLWRGSIPCEVAFLGEAPGPDENEQGEPFVGASGKLLNYLLESMSKELSTYGVTLRYLICNVLVCYPGKDSKGKFNVPTPEQSSTCLPHITELLKLAKPKVLIPLGQTAQKHAKSVFKGAVVPEVWHPSYILRGGGVKSERYRITYNKISKAVCKVYAKGD